MNLRGIFLSTLIVLSIGYTSSINAMQLVDTLHPKSRKERLIFQQALTQIFFDACEGGYISVLPDFIKHGFNVNTRSPNKTTPLHVTGWGGHPDIAMLLIEHGANINAKNHLGLTPLDVTCQNDNFKVQRLIVANILLKAGANPNITDRKNNTALHYACRNNHTGIINLLLRHKADVNIQNSEKISPLHFAAIEGNLRIIESLITYGAHINARGGFQRATPLTLAVTFKNTDAVKYLLAHGADINAETSNGIAPLDIAYYINSQIIIELFARYGACIPSDEQAEENKQAFFTELNQKVQQEKQTESSPAPSPNKAATKSLPQKSKKNSKVQTKTITPVKIAQPTDTSIEYKLLMHEKFVWPKNLTTNQHTALFDHIKELRKWPSTIGIDVTNLKNLDNTYRLRVGGYRVIFSVETNESEIRIHEIAPRKSVYKNMKFNLS